MAGQQQFPYVNVNKAMVYGNSNNITILHLQWPVHIMKLTLNIKESHLLGNFSVDKMPVPFVCEFLPI